MLYCGPSAAASAFSSAGLGTFQCPVDIRFSSVWTAVMVSAGVNAQCPARFTKICLQQVAVAVPVDDAAVGLLVLRHDQAVAGGVHGEDGDRDLAVEGDVPGQVGHGATGWR